MYDELNSFIGLLVYELDEKIYKESMISNDYMFEEARTEINKIKNKLLWIQKKLNLQNFDDKDIQILNKWTIDYDTPLKSLPYGHCSVAKIICKKFLNIPFINNLEYFLENLSYYINYNIYYIE